jgi:hypothetical protein
MACAGTVSFSALHTHQGDLRVAGRIGRVLDDGQLGLVGEDPVEHVGGVPDGRGDHPGGVGRVLVGDVGPTPAPSGFSGTPEIRAKLGIRPSGQELAASLGAAGEVTRVRSRVR